MVALASRAWDAMQRRGEQSRIRRFENADKLRFRPTELNDSGTFDKHSIPAYRQGGVQRRGLGRVYGGVTRTSRSNFSSQQRDNKARYPTGKNDKGETVCFQCGSTAHRVTDCPEKGNPPSTVQTIQSATIAELTDSSENE
ncbi:uncharacterized protein V1513DRAFT_434643 [Lipomyces chichibuensis]|uniref:uncharacterized protein n=1 Tax=Lipomyces chichibuensis TaxID=1546026 RepID=UPI0033437722